MTPPRQLLQRLEQRHPEWPTHLSHFLQGYDRVAEPAQEMLAHLDQNYVVQPDIKRVIQNLCVEKRNR